LTTTTITALVFLVLMAGGLAGAGVRRALPRDDLADDSKEVVRLGTGLIGTLAALVLGLLIASAKSSYDTQSNQVRRITSDIVQLDLVLAHYGPEARSVRARLRGVVEPMIERIWREGRAATTRREAFESTEAGEDTFAAVQGLAPETDSQRSLKSRALDVVADLSQTRTLLYAQGGNSIPKPFLAVLVFWLTTIFLSFSLFSRLNSTSIVALVVLALSASAAIFLILGLSTPFEGLLQLSSDPLRYALSPLGD
jgi:hypothetical protein